MQNSRNSPSATSTQRHVRLESSSEMSSTSSHDSSDCTSYTFSSSHSSGSPSLTASSSGSGSLPSFNHPTTPRSSHSSSSSRSLHRYASRDSLYSPLSSASEDKFTQIPMVSPRERRSSSATVGASARRRKSLASLNNTTTAGGTFTPTLYGSLTPARGSGIGGAIPTEGRHLSKKHVEASRRSAKEALEEDLRALDLVGGGLERSAEDYALDCYLTSLDYLVKAWRPESSDTKTRKAIRARLQVLLDSLVSPEEIAEEKAQKEKRRQAELELAKQSQTLQGKPTLARTLWNQPFKSLWTGLVVLHILAVVERAVLGTSVAPALLQAAHCYRATSPTCEALETAVGSDNADEMDIIAIIGHGCDSETSQSSPDLGDDDDDDSGNVTFLPSPRSSPSSRLRSFPRQRLSLAPSVELVGENDPLA